MNIQFHSPDVVTRLPVAMQAIFPKANPSWSKDNTSIETPTKAITSSTPARFINIRLYGVLIWNMKCVYFDGCKKQMLILTSKLIET